MVNIKIKTDGDAFKCSEGGVAGWEVAAILRDIADRIEEGETEGKFHDSNGNTCGSFKITGRKS